MDLEVITRQPKVQTHDTPLLFVHGGWHGAWAWDEHFLPYFADHGFVSHALNLRGHGSSPNPKPLRWTRIKDYVDDVVQVAESITPRPVILAHSMGGLIAQHALTRFEAPAGVLIASMPPGGMGPTVVNFARHQPAAFLEMNLRLRLWPMVRTPERTRWLFFSDSMPEAEFMKHFARLQDEAYMVFPDAVVFAKVDPRKVKSPMLVIGAENDQAFLPQQTRAIAKAYNTTAQIFPNMAHDMMLEADWQQVADCVITWLTERGL